MWMASLKEKNRFPCIYFNAWDSDFTGDPLVSFIGEMKASLDLPLQNAGASKAKDSPEGKRAADILALMDQLSRARASDGLRSTIQRIELTEQFTIG